MPLSSNIKPEPNPPLTLPRVIRAREMYAEGFTVARILAHCEMSLGTLYACLDGNPFADQGEPLPAIPRRRQVLKKRHRALRTDSVSLTNRLLRTAERQVREIETRLSQREQPPVERERDVRMLMNLTRALRDLRTLREDEPEPEPPPQRRGTARLACAQARSHHRGAGQPRRQSGKRIGGLRATRLRAKTGAWGKSRNRRKAARGGAAQRVTPEKRRPAKPSGRPRRKRRG